MKAMRWMPDPRSKDLTSKVIAPATAIPVAVPAALPEPMLAGDPLVLLAALLQTTPPSWWSWWILPVAALAILSATVGVLLLRSRRIEQERRRIAEELQASESRLSEIVEHTSNVFYSHTVDHELTYVSPTVKDVLGVPAAQVPYRWTEFATDHPVNEEAMRSTLRAIETGERQPPFELQLRHENGSPVWVRATESPLVKDGKVIGIVGSLTDITETRNAEENQERLEAQLEQARRIEAVGRLAGGIAHDFNNLLTAILGHVDLVALELEDDDPLRHELEEVSRACDRGASLVRQLLAIGRRQVSSPSTLDVNAVIEERLRMFQRVAGAHIDFEADLEPGVLNAILDESQLDQILLNLVLNARDAMPEGGRLTVATRWVALDAAPAEWDASSEGFSPGRFVLLEVTDTGVGMPPEVEARIFEPFFTTKEVGSGTGLGLSTVYGIVRQNRGHVEVRTAPGEGTRFRIWLPAEGVRSDRGPQEGERVDAVETTTPDP